MQAGRTPFAGVLDAMPPSIKPTKEQIRRAEGKTVPDVIAPGLKVLFCGINPGLYSGAVGHHFARPGNRFWPALHAAGFTPRLFSPFEEHELLDLGYGVTNIVSRATATAAELTDEELRHGADRLANKLRTHRPRYLAILGITAYRTAFHHSKATLGPQEHVIHDTRLWVLPNPSGLNAHHQMPALARMFTDLRKAAEAPEEDDE